MKIPSNNMVLMIGSGILSLLLWMWIGAEERSEVIVTVPLEFRNLPRAYEITADEPLIREVNLWIKGSTALIRNLRPQEITAWLDLQDTNPGQRIFELTPQSVRVPYGFTVLRISPSQVNLTIEETIRKKVQVMPKLLGDPPEGFAVKETIVSPPQVEVIGPRSQVNLVRHVTTDSIDVTSIKQDRSERVNVGTANSQVRLGNIKEVNVMLRVSEIEDLFTMRQIPIIHSDTKRGVQFNPRTVRIEVQAPKRMMPDLLRTRATAILDLEGLTPGVYELTPRIEFPNDAQGRVSVKSINPARIHVRIQ
jgi:YbbR domain-containing protein